MAIGGERRKENDFENKLRVGLFEARVVAINPTEEELKEKFDIELKEDSKLTEYLGEDNEGNQYLRVDVWLEDVKTGDRYKGLSFFLKNMERENKDMTKKQYINSSGTSVWVDDPSNLYDWFIEREYRVAMVGEADLYTFMQAWLNHLDFRSDETKLELDWKKLMKGNVSELKEQIDGEWAGTFGALATINVVDKDGEVKEYQNIYNKGFLPSYSLKQFRLIDFDSQEVRDKIEARKPKDRKFHEKFVLDVYGEYGSKDFFLLKDIKDYDPADTIVSSNEVKDEDASY